MTPVKKSTYIPGHGVVEYEENIVYNEKKYHPVEKKSTEFYEIESDHMRCPITEVESPSHARRVKKIGGDTYSSTVAPVSQPVPVTLPPTTSSVIGGSKIEHTYEDNDNTHHIVKSSKLVPKQKSTYVEGHGIVNYTANEFEEVSEVVSVPKPKLPPTSAENVKGIVANLRTWINK